MSASVPDATWWPPASGVRETSEVVRSVTTTVGGDVDLVEEGLVEQAKFRSAIHAIHSLRA